MYRLLAYGYFFFLNLYIACGLNSKFKINNCVLN